MRHVLDFLGAVAGWSAHQPPVIWLAIVLLGSLTGAVARGVRRADHRDPQRLFTASQRREIAHRAGGRCEHKALLLPRCRRAGQAADHVIPHSRGGVTELGNAQLLCRQHNLAKSAHMPSRAYLRRLDRRRKTYFPPGVTTRVDRSVRYRRA